HLLRQAAQYGGESFSPSATANGIAEARAQIQRIKAILRENQANVTDTFIDEPSEATNIEATTIMGDRSIAGNQSSINIAGGDYAEGNIDKRQGVFIEGGTIYGPVVGVGSGTITITPITSPPAVLLETAHTQVQQVLSQARERGEIDLAEDLQGVVLSLQAAIRAQNDGKVERRGIKLDEARDRLLEIAANHPELVQSARIILD